MTKVVSEFTITAFGTTREECIEQMDSLGNAMLNDTGGEPWIVPDDDTKKVVAANIAPTMADDQGFCYVGIRKYMFRGPLVGLTNQPMHDGFKRQGHADDF